MDNSIYRQLVDHAPDAILFADREGIIRLWNAGAEATFGFSAEEALGQSLDLIIPEKLRQRHWDGYHRVMASGETKYGSDLLSVPALHKEADKRLFSDFSIIMIKDDDGQLQGIAAVMRDSTAQKAKEKELRERIKELEGTTPSP
jgi:PAS domain S-box-containing protein